jgi:hypothetical protein
MKSMILRACPVALLLCTSGYSGQAAETASPSLAADTANIVCYAWADQPTASSYIPSTSYSFNRRGGNIRITRSGPGSYTVICRKVPGFAGPRGGHVQVSAYGSSSVVCNTTGWGGTPLSAGVQCRALLTGALTDSFFDFLFVR